VRHTMLALSVAMVAVLTSYGMALLVVLYAYRRGYKIVGKPELALRFAAKILADLDEFTRPLAVRCSADPER
jgi:hypothetical protein